MPATVVPEHVPKVLVGLGSWKTSQDARAADAATRIVEVLRPGGPAQELVPLARGVLLAVVQGVGSVIIRLEAEVRPLSSVR